MKVSIKYYEILEENLREELIWLTEEFRIMFKPKIDNYNEKDKKIANEILDYILDNTYVYDNIKLYNLLFDAIENLEKNYPGLI
ncbi:MAG: hypothetical protein ACFFA4_14590 [Promethearchaeota archaeon]